MSDMISNQVNNLPVTVRTFSWTNFFSFINSQKEIKVPDNVKDMWAPPHTEPGIPPLLTMPGVQSPNDLVNHVNIFCFCDALNLIVIDSQILYEMQ